VWGPLKKNNTAAVLESVDLRPSIVNFSEGSKTLLRWAVINGNYEMTLGLLDRGAKIQFFGSSCGSSWNLLIDASYTGCLPIVRLLLDCGADPCSSGAYPCTRGAPPYPCSRSGQLTALGIAADRGYHDVCMLLLSKGADLLAPHRSGTALTQYGFLNRRALNSLSYEEIQQQIASLEAAWYSNHN